MSLNIKFAIAAAAMAAPLVLQGCDGSSSPPNTPGVCDPKTNLFPNASHCVQCDSGKYTTPGDCNSEDLGKQFKMTTNPCVWKPGNSTNPTCDPPKGGMDAWVGKLTPNKAGLDTCDKVGGKWDLSVTDDCDTRVNKKADLTPITWDAIDEVLSNNAEISFLKAQDFTKCKSSDTQSDCKIPDKQTRCTGWIQKGGKGDNKIQILIKKGVCGQTKDTDIYIAQDIWESGVFDIFYSKEVDACRGSHGKCAINANGKNFQCMSIKDACAKKSEADCKAMPLTCGWDKNNGVCLTKQKDCSLFSYPGTTPTADNKYPNIIEKGCVFKKITCVTDKTCEMNDQKACTINSHVAGDFNDKKGPCTINKGDKGTCDYNPKFNKVQ